MAGRRCPECGRTYLFGVMRCSVCPCDTVYDPPVEGVPEAEALEPPLFTELDRVEGWRLACLLEAGYPTAQACLLAAVKVDLHRALELVEQGCEPELAARILL